MNVHPDVNFEELARSTDDFNGAQLKAVCVEAGMLALRRDATEVSVSFSVLYFFNFKANKLPADCIIRKKIFTSVTVRQMLNFFSLD
jgi:SpoVK/Ycf46/Vps4 family AAA+-type ATPase